MVTATFRRPYAACGDVAPKKISQGHSKLAEAEPEACLRSPPGELSRYPPHSVSRNLKGKSQAYPDQVLTRYLICEVTQRIYISGNLRCR